MRVYVWLLMARMSLRARVMNVSRKHYVFLFPHLPGKSATNLHFFPGKPYSTCEIHPLAIFSD